MRATGYLKTSLKGQFAFRLLGAGAARLAVNGEELLVAEGDLSSAPAREAKLNKGYNLVQVDYDSPAQGDAQWRVEWAGADFGFEPLPRGALFHDASSPALARGKLLRAGRQTFAELGCARCHAASGAFAPRDVDAAPSLAKAQSRLSPAWLAAWILDPAAFRHDSPMPRLLSADAADARRQAADLAAWLTSLPAEEVAAPQANEDLVEQGVALYENLGCIACHRLTPPAESDEFDRVTLHHVAAKYSAAGLSEYLAKPHEFRPATTMPDFGLTGEETAALVAFLFDRAKGAVDPLPELTSADPRRGGELFVSLGCRQCHAAEQPAAAAPIAKSLAGADGERGCLSKNREGLKPGTPDFTIDDHRRSALLAYLNTPPRDAVASPADDLQSLFAKLRCNACHDRDGVRSRRPDILADDGEQGLVPELLPDLTHAGEKLRTEWVEKLLAGKIEYRPRPWLAARMPAFPAYAEALATGLAARHAPSPESSIDLIPTKWPETASVGQSLTLKDGLDCRQCHGLGREQPTADKDAKLALGVNFSYVPERVRKPYYDRWMIDPLRIDPLTKMPKFAFDGEHTKAHQILDGDAKAQFEAIWEYLRSL